MVEEKPKGKGIKRRTSETILLIFWCRWLQTTHVTGIVIEDRSKRGLRLAWNRRAENRGDKIDML